MRGQRFENLGVAAVTPLASDVVSRMRGTIPGIKVVLAWRVRAGVVAIGASGLRGDLRGCRSRNQ